MGEMRSLAGNYVVFHHSSTVVPTDLSTFACLPVLAMHPVHLLWAILPRPPLQFSLNFIGEGGV